MREANGPHPINTKSTKTNYAQNCLLEDDVGQKEANKDFKNKKSCDCSAFWKKRQLLILKRVYKEEKIGPLHLSILILTT